MLGGFTISSPKNDGQEKVENLYYRTDKAERCAGSMVMVMEAEAESKIEYALYVPVPSLRGSALLGSRAK